MVLVVGSWLLVESLWNLGRVDPGFRSADVVSLKVAPVSRVSTARARHAYYTRVLDTIGRIPGVQAAGGIHIPPMGSGNWNFRYVAEDTPIAPGETLPTANFRIVTPGYFRALGIPMVAGRDVEEGDLSNSGGLESGGVGLVNESLAHRLWPGEDPIGKRMRLSGPEGQRFTVVGVVGDIRQFSLSRQPRDEIYWPAGQWTIGALTLMVRTDGREGMPASLREAIWSVDGDVPGVTGRRDGRGRQPHDCNVSILYLRVIGAGWSVPVPCRTGRLWRHFICRPWAHPGDRHANRPGCPA